MFTAIILVVDYCRFKKHGKNWAKAGKAELALAATCDVVNTAVGFGLAAWLL